MTETDMIQRLKGLEGIEDVSDIQVVVQIVFDYLIGEDDIKTTCDLLKNPFKSLQEKFPENNHFEILSAMMASTMKRAFAQYPDGKEGEQILQKFCATICSHKMTILLVKFNPLS